MDLECNKDIGIVVWKDQVISESGNGVSHKLGIGDWMSQCFVYLKVK
jgi:hypothetical protein